MKSKKGISMVVLLVAVFIMIVLVSSAIVLGSRSITTANFEEYQSEISRVSDLVNIYKIENGSLPITGEVLDPKSISYDFINEANMAGDEFNKLFVIDMKLLNNTTINIGNGNAQNKDAFVVSENTNNIYYIKGFKFEGKVVHGRYN